MDNKEEEKVILNGQEVEKKVVEELKENQDSNTKVIEKSKGEFVQRLND